MAEDLEGLAALARRAGDLIMAIYEEGFEVGEKTDGSAVTIADEKAEALILDGLATLYPDTPVLAEEAASRGDVPVLGRRFLLVDPLDGTREFVNRTGEFTVNIAVVEDGVAVAGVVLAPAADRLFAGEIGRGAWSDSGGAREALRVRARSEGRLTAVASRSHRSPQTQAFLDDLGATDFQPAGSSLKFCLVAAGEADVYPRLGRTMEWDTGAGQAVLEAAGGRVSVLDESGREGGPLRYAKADRGYDNPHFIAWGGASGA